MLKEFPDRWRTVWDSNRTHKMATRPGGLKSNWPSVDIGHGWFALETDDDLEFVDFTFYRQQCLVKFWGICIPISLEPVLTINFRAGSARCHPANLRRAVNLGLFFALDKFMAR